MVSFRNHIINKIISIWYAFHIHTSLHNKGSDMCIKLLNNVQIAEINNNNNIHQFSIRSQLAVMSIQSHSSVANAAVYPLYWAILKPSTMGQHR